MDLAGQMNAAVRMMLSSGLRTWHPDDPPVDHLRRMAELLLGVVLAEKVYGLLEEVGMPADSE